jgi:microcystin-dependent protein
MTFIRNNSQYNYSSHTLPVGTVVSFSGKTCPMDWKFCDGSELNMSDYPELFSAIKQFYGGSKTKFKLPDLVGRIILGEDKNGVIISGEYNSTIGGVGGELKHTLTEEELAKHKHTGKTSITGDSGGGADVNYSITDPDRGNPVLPRIETTETGNDVPHNNMQPYIVMNYIIKTKSSVWKEINIVTNSKITFRTPVGSIISVSSYNKPEGCLLCDGSLYPKNDYVELSTLLGNTWGGDSNFFAVPDLRGRLLVGSNGIDVGIQILNDLGDAGGYDICGLSNDEMPSHSHEYSVDTLTLSNQFVAPYLPVKPALSNSLENLTSEISGLGYGHNNMQPYATVNHFIKSIPDVNTEAISNYSFINSHSLLISAITYFIDASSGSINITLSSQYPLNSKVTIRKIDNTANKVSIVDQEYVLIDNQLSYVLSGSQPITLMKTTNGWFISQL